MAQVLQQQDAPSWLQWVTDFDKTAVLFEENYRGLQELGPWIRSRHPEQFPTYNRLMREGAENQARVNSLRSTRDTVVGWLQTIGQYTTSAFDWLRGAVGLGEMGAIPFVIIGIATAVSALAVIGKWTKDAYVFSRRLNELQRLEAQGIAPAEAARIVDKAAGKTEGFLFGINTTWLALGALALIAIPLILRRR